MELQQSFKNALSCWASGVTVVAVRDANGLAYGLTVSSFSSVSMDPLLILVCLNNNNRAPDMIKEAGGFAVSVLAKGQEDASNYFARSGREPAAELEVATEPAKNGHPLVSGASATLSCTVHDMIVQGTHTIVIGRVDDCQGDGAVDPLIYFRRAYRTVSE